MHWVGVTVKKVACRLLDTKLIDIIHIKWDIQNNVTKFNPVLATTSTARYWIKMLLE